VWFTSALFSFELGMKSGDADGVGTAWRLLMGMKEFFCDELHFDARRKGWTPPAPIHVSVNAGRWRVSVSNETETAEGWSFAPTEVSGEPARRLSICTSSPRYSCSISLWVWTGV